MDMDKSVQIGFKGRKEHFERRWIEKYKSNVHTLLRTLQNLKLLRMGCDGNQNSTTSSHVVIFRMSSFLEA